MNFKPTFWKSIISIIGGVIIGFIYSAMYESYDVCDINNCPTYFEQLSMYNQLIPPLIISILVCFALIYLIWSFIQKKK